MAQKVNDDRLLFEATQQKLYNLMAFLGYTVAIPTFLFSGWLVESLFGPAYIKAAPLLSVLVWSGLFTHLGTARTIFLVSMNWTKVNLICLLIGCICNVALNFLLIPRYGAMGAVFASSFAYWLAIHGSCIFFKPLRNTARMMTKALLFPKFW
jgi:O-antigen/teichoic acid export membrane protein